MSSDQILAQVLNGKPDDTIGMSYTKEGFAELVAGAAPARLGRPPSIVHTPASNPIITDKAVRHWLSVPRRRLLIEHHSPVPGDILLQSPRAGEVVDSRNGPFPEVWAIQESLGDARTFLVNFQCVTYVNECEEATGQFGAFLSNRYSQTQDIDVDGFLSIVTEGEARFRTDMVYGKVNPDVLRPFLFLPIPNGFQRTDIQVAGLSDVTGLKYAFVDRQMPQQLVVGDEVGATRIEATYRQAMLNNEEALGSVLGAIDRHYSIAVNSKWAKPDESEGKATPKKRKRKKPKKDTD